MDEEIILRLVIAFDNLANKGLFFWLSLLLPKDVPYDDFVDKSFADILHSPSAEKVTLDFYKSIMANLKYLRARVLVAPEVKAQIEKIRDGLIEKIAQEEIVNKVKNNLKIMLKNLNYAYDL
jgi:hypothetical protein